MWERTPRVPLSLMSTAHASEQRNSVVSLLACTVLFSCTASSMLLFSSLCPVFYYSIPPPSPGTHPVFSTLTRPSQLLTSLRWKTMPTLITGSIDATRESTGLIQACGKPGAVKLCSRRGYGRDLQKGLSSVVTSTNRAKIYQEQGQSSIYRVRNTRRCHEGNTFTVNGTKDQQFSVPCRLKL